MELLKGISSSMARRDKSWPSTPLRHPEAIKSDDIQRPTWSSAPFVKDSMFIDQDYFSLPLSSRDNQVR